MNFYPLWFLVAYVAMGAIVLGGLSILVAHEARCAIARRRL